MVERGRGWEMHHGDCLDVMQVLPEADHVICDPPYLLNFGNCITRGRRDPTSRVRDMSYRPFAPDDVRVVGQFFRPRRWCVVWHDAESGHLWRAAMTGVRFVRTGLWRRLNPCPQFTGDRPGTGFELCTIAHGREERLHWNGGGHAAMWEHAQLHGTTGDGANDHPTPKPLALMLEQVQAFTDPGETILDPFAGSGTTGVACLRLGRKFIGVEKDPKYFALCCERLRAEEKGHSLQAERARQEVLFR